VRRRREPAIAAFGPRAVGRKLSGVAVTVKPEGDGRQALVLAAEAAAVGEARAWLSSLTAVLVARPRRCDLELVVSELVTNAVRHGRKGGEILLAATPKQDFVCVQVTDDGPGFVPRPGAMASAENGGFGLFLVEQLTRRWGVTREQSRTRVWFEFDYESPER
jgi:serine/threonine-protein kinase RsbW